MQDTDKVALDRVLKARAELIMTRTFYGVLVGQVTPVPSRKFPTMATDGKTHFFNPEFITSLPQTELLGVQAHESEHDARRHHTRRGGRDPKEWNICTDYAINIDLVDQGFKLPKGALVDPKYRGMSAEDIYRTREIDRALEQQKQQKDESPDADEDEQDDADSEPGQDEGDNEADDADGQDGDEGDDEQDGQDEGDGKGGDAPDGDDGQDGQPGEGAGEPGGEAKGDGEGNTPGDADGDTQGDGTGTGTGDADGEEAGDGSPTSCGDPGGCGEVLDAAETSAELAADDAKWETVLRQAAMLAAKRGDAPGHVAREIERADHPPQDWRETLRAYFDGGATTQETWARPNRRFIGGGLYLPGRQRDGVNKVVFMIDTSGSVTYYPGALEAIQIETQAALDEGFIDEAVVMYGDVRVTRVDHYRNGDEIEFDPRGGGGTVMRPLFQHVADEVSDASLIVAFTDLEIEPESKLGPEPHCPVLWAVVGYPASVRHYMENPPWGAAAIDVRPDA